ncbi:hypothetical protein QJS10_CPA08g01600 [Acorus calamus]|uniref:Uncharacterized protein n=1 Tax=Acorus calamus TaxID=4465 RepID=A0AAV9E7B9_ACOCL|nr:hypothetical protein QJS10_CPA08g01600 [Acorus calamus]
MEHLLCSCSKLINFWRQMARVSLSQGSFQNLEEMWDRMTNCPSLGNLRVHQRVAQALIPAAI